MDVLRFDVLADGEPVGSVEARVDGRRLRVTVGDTTGESFTYTHRKPHGFSRSLELGDSPFRGENEWVGYALNVAQSAFAVRWWHRRRDARVAARYGKGN